MTTTPILSRKLQHMFRLLDADSDGFLTADDMTTYASQLAVAFPEQPQKIEKLSIALGHMWEAYLRDMDADGDGRVDVGEYEQGVRTAIADDAEPFIGALQDAVTAWFALFDADDNGLSVDEYTQLGLAVTDFTPQELGEAFRHLDLDGDGFLQPEEIRTAVTEFFTSEDPDADGNWLYGPL
ncbi:EF-hand domain-containing protein [Streptomyces sp. 6N223]|uniref:EF-hand domain-containing protein n=1 Tax=Streptomyces sp. 6N223 TaxID=3457412 RepID=UPI003FD68EAA